MKWREIPENERERVFEEALEARKKAEEEIQELKKQCLGDVERKKAENPVSDIQLAEQVKRLTKDFSEVSKDFERLTSSVSHDLRAPLRAIVGWSQILLEDFGARLDDEGKLIITRIISLTKSLSAQMDALVDFSRINHLPMQPGPTSLSDIATMLVGEFQRAEPERGIDVVIDPDIVVEADPSLLKTVLRHLLENAWKFSAQCPKTHIEFRKNTQGDLTVYSVSDNGAGFENEYVSRLFSPFQRLHRQDEFPGIGIGLAVVRKIILRHCGRVWAEGTPGKGARISFTLNEN
ncbi:MAG: ATP-binding protein [Candidatus Ozemobacteraceae bacterium]